MTKIGKKKSHAHKEKKKTTKYEKKKTNTHTLYFFLYYNFSHETSGGRSIDVVGGREGREFTTMTTTSYKNSAGLERKKNK